MNFLTMSSIAGGNHELPTTCEKEIAGQTNQMQVAGSRA